MTWSNLVFETMGTVVSLTLDADDNSQDPLTFVRETFEHFDTVFSLYKPASELSRIADGRLSLPDASEEVRDAYTSALEWRSATGGDFTPNRPDGVIDLSGIVKAIAMATARNDLFQSGVYNWCMNVGGDVLVAGNDAKGEAWTVGIVDPVNRSALLTAAVLDRSRMACATSGNTERGDHIWTVGAAPLVFVQATVLADDIITADVLATAIIAGGPSALDQICAKWDIDAMTIDREGNIRMTPRFARLRAAL